LTLISGAFAGNIGGALIFSDKSAELAGVDYSERLAACNPSARLATSRRPELSEHCCQSSSALEERVCEGMMRAVSLVARSGNGIYVGISVKGEMSWQIDSSN
jgi:NAD(P)H-hydrate repair Nnr-like enzyme with NAD(P)H-hydrate dehydratase domain